MLVLLRRCKDLKNDVVFICRLLRRLRAAL